jgi:aspartate/methionine/tyrosine aminotransferase
MGAGGWRWGRLVFPPALNDLFIGCSQNANNPCNLFEEVDQLMIRKPIQIQTHLMYEQTVFRKAFQVIQMNLESTQIQFTPCDSAWYTLLNFKNYKFDLNTMGIKTSHQLVEYLWDTYKIIMVQGSDFGFHPTELIVRWAFVDLQFGDQKGDVDMFEKIQETCTLLYNMTTELDLD